MLALLLTLPMLAPAQAAQEPIRLFDGKSLAGWKIDVPSLDDKPEEPKPFVVRDGMLVSLGQPFGHLVTEREFENYRLTVEYRFSKTAGNSGVVVHVSTLRHVGNLLPKGLEVQIRHNNAGDFHLFGETLSQVPPATGDAPASTARRLIHYANAEKPVGEWNAMVIDCVGSDVKVHVNGQFVNHGRQASATKGKIALQSEGAEVEFRKVELVPVNPPR
jgi:hypothetical protein